MPFSGAAKSGSFELIFYPIDAISDFCRASLECSYTELAFHSEDGAYHKNDKSSFLYKRLLSTDTAKIYLLKSGVRQTQITNNNYGDFYNFGDLSDIDLIGVFIDWRSVFLAFGNGKFQIEIEYTRAGNPDSFLSIPYWVRPYDVDAADGTVRIESINNGEIINGFNFTGLNWPQWYRIEGKLSNQEPQYNSEYSLDNNWQQNIIQKELYNKYTLQTSLVYRDMLLNIQNYSLMGDSMFITDYNKYNADIYRKLPVELEDIKRTEYDLNMRASLEITFRDKGTKVKRI